MYSQTLNQITIAESVGKTVSLTDGIFFKIYTDGTYSHIRHVIEDDNYIDEPLSYADHVELNRDLLGERPLSPEVSLLIKHNFIDKDQFIKDCEQANTTANESARNKEINKLVNKLKALSPFVKISFPFDVEF